MTDKAICAAILGLGEAGSEIAADLMRAGAGRGPQLMGPLGANAGPSGMWRVRGASAGHA